MKSMTKLATTLAACALISTPGLAQQNGNGGGPGATGGNGAILTYIDTLPMQAIDAGELADLVHMRQEEKLARDVYQVLYQTWNLTAFDNIAKAEQSHMDLTLAIFQRYGLVDPLTSDVIGVYPNPLFTGLFKKLVDFGARSSTHALLIGAVIEDLDIFDLHFALANTNNKDIAVVWQNLMRGSRNHMRSFYGLLFNLGFPYPGIWIGMQNVLAIVNTPYENQPVDENGVVLP